MPAAKFITQIALMLDAVTLADVAAAAARAPTQTMFYCYCNNMNVEYYKVMHCLMSNIANEDSRGAETVDPLTKRND